MALVCGLGAPFLTSSPFIQYSWSVHSTLTRDARATWRQNSQCLTFFKTKGSQRQGEVSVWAYTVFLWTPETPLPKIYHCGNVSSGSWLGILCWSIFLMTSWAAGEVYGCSRHTGLLMLEDETEGWLGKVGKDIIHSLWDTNSKLGLHGIPFQIPKEGIGHLSLSSVFSEESLLCCTSGVMPSSRQGLMNKES